MSRRQWTGLAGVLFGAAMITGVGLAGSTPNADRSNAAKLYEDYWNSSSHQNRAVISMVILSFASVLLLAFATGLSALLRRTDDGPLPTLVAAAGAMTATLLAAGASLLNGVGLSGQWSRYAPEGNVAILIENIGYCTFAVGVMSAAAMAVAWSMSNRQARVIPQWTVVLSVLLALAGIGSIALAWTGFMLLPLWAVVVGICLLVLRDSAPATA